MPTRGTRTMLVIGVLCMLFFVFLRQRKKGDAATVDTPAVRTEDKPVAPPTPPPPPLPPPPPSLPPGTFKVQSVRLKARDGQSERAVICSEVKLSMTGRWLRPSSGTVTTVAPGHKGDWRLLDDDTNSHISLVHTDTTTPGNAIVLYYGGVEADSLVLWVRTDVVPQSGADHMYNVDVEVVGDNNRVLWKKQLNPSLYFPDGKYYSFQFQKIPSD